MTDADIDRGELRAAVRDMLDDASPAQRVRELADTVDGFDPQLWQRLAEMGLTGIEITEEHGGAGATFGDLAVVLVEIGRHLAGGAFAATTVLGAGALQLAPQSELTAEWLPLLAAGERRATAAGLDVDGAAALHARRDGAGWVIDGSSALVADLDGADLLIVVASTNDGSPVILAVDAADGALRPQPAPMLDITRRFADVTVTGLRVDGRAVLAHGADANRIFGQLRDRAALAAACDALGAAQRALELTVDYARTRVQFDRPIGSFQAVKHRCTDMFIAVETGRIALDEAIDSYGAMPETASAAVSRAKAYCCDASASVTEAGVDLHGGIGFTWEHDMHLLLKRVGLDRALYGDSRWHRRRAADLTFPPG